MVETRKSVVEHGGKTYVRTIRHGYIYLNEVVDGVISKKAIPEHRLVYELAYDVTLPSNVQVHHLNRDVTDNRPDNLIALPIYDHTKLHAFENRNYDMKMLIDCEAMSQEQKKSVVSARAKLVAYGDKIYHKSYSNGYVLLYPVVDGVVDFSTRIPEHKLVYEIAHGVQLPSSAIIHHVNGIKDDNRPENLVLQEASKKERRVSGVSIRRSKPSHASKNYCIDCGTEISRGAVRCSACHHDRRRMGMPSSEITKEKLSSLIQEHTNAEIARMYGVSDRAVCKWRKKYGLPSSNEQHGWDRGKRANVSTWAGRSV